MTDSHGVCGHQPSHQNRASILVVSTLACLWIMTIVWYMQARSLAARLPTLLPSVDSSGLCAIPPYLCPSCPHPAVPRVSECGPGSPCLPASLSMTAASLVMRHVTCTTCLEKCGLKPDDSFWAVSCASWQLLGVPRASCHIVGGQRGMGSAAVTFSLTFTCTRLAESADLEFLDWDMGYTDRACCQSALGCRSSVTSHLSVIGSHRHLVRRGLACRSRAGRRQPLGEGRIRTDRNRGRVGARKGR